MPTNEENLTLKRQALELRDSPAFNDFALAYLRHNRDMARCKMESYRASDGDNLARMALDRAHLSGIISLVKDFEKHLSECADYKQQEE